MQLSTILITSLIGTAVAAPQGQSYSTTTSSDAPTPIVATYTTKGTPLQSLVNIPVSTAVTASPLPSPTDYISAALYGHNIHRANHSSVYLIYNSQLAGFAANVAASCNFAHDLSQGGGGYGQNLAAYGSDDLSDLTQQTVVGLAISDQWYNSEIGCFLPDYYGQSTPDLDEFETWGHFSQVVWASTTSVGCATQLCPAGSVYDDVQSYFTVCNYQGAGNMDGFYSSNINSPLGHPDYSP